MKKSNEIKTHVEVGGAILTEKAIHQLKTLQEHNNEMLENNSRIIADAVCFMAKHYDDISAEERDAANYLMFELTFVRDNMNELAKP